MTELTYHDFQPGTQAVKRLSLLLDFTMTGDHMDITSAALATIISATTSAVVSLLIANTNKKKHLDDQLDGILNIAVQFPYLESRKFTETWRSDFDVNDEKYLRYEVYCTMVFNFLSRLCSYYKYNEAKIENHVVVKDWVRLHKKYWKDPTEAYENTDSYDKEFVELIEKYLR